MLTDHPVAAARLDDSHCALVPTTMSASRISSLIRSLNLACLIALASGRSSHDGLRAWIASSIAKPNNHSRSPQWVHTNVLLNQKTGSRPDPSRFPCRYRGATFSGNATAFYDRPWYDSAPVSIPFRPDESPPYCWIASNSRPVKCDSSWSSHFDSGSLTGPLPRGRRWSRRGLAEPEIARSRHSSGAFGSSSRIANATLVEPQAKSDAWFPGSNAGLRRILKDRPLWCDSTYQSHQ